MGLTSLEFKDLVFGYEEKIILNGVNLKFDEPGLVCILGPNGVGKTTLVKCGNKLLKPSSGKALLDGRDVSEYGLHELANKMAFVSATSTATFSMTVTEAILMGRHPRSGWTTTDEDLRKVSESIKLLGLEEFMDRDFRKLSAGQAQRVKIARGLVQEPEILILDEPTSNLDVKYQMDVMRFLKTYAKTAGILVLMVCHDLNITAAYADRVVLMYEGNVFADGDPKHVLTEDNIETVYKVKARVIDVMGAPHIILIPQYDE
jgi:iron complex transport system ATP-binding protein